MKSATQQLIDKVFQINPSAKELGEGFARQLLELALQSEKEQWEATQKDISENCAIDKISSDSSDGPKTRAYINGWNDAVNASMNGSSSFQDDAMEEVENRNMPAMPIVNSEGFSSHPCSGSIEPGTCTGLTKREHFAGLAMQGLCNATEPDGTWAHEAKDVAVAAVEYADALLNQLQATEGEG